MKILKKNWKIVSLITPLFIVGCSADKVPLAGKRSDFLQVRHTLECDKNAAAFKIIIKPPVLNTEWTQVGGNAAHAMPNVEAGAINTVLWSTDIGSGSSSDQFLLAHPVVGDNLIYAMDAQGRVSALNMVTGKKQWSLDTTNRHKKYSFHGGGISYDKGTLYVSTLAGEVWALNSKTGEIRWMKDIDLPLRTAPTVQGKRLFVVTTNNRSIALNTENGEVIWRHEDTQDALGFMGGGNPTIAGESELIIPYSSGNVFAVRAENGVMLWHDMLTPSESHSSVSMISQIKARPVVDHHHIYVTSQNGHMMALNLLTGNRLWELNVGSIRTPALGENVLFLLTTSQQLICLTKEGGKIIWITQLPRYVDEEKQKDPLGWAGPVLAGSRLLLTGSNGKILTVDPTNGKIITTFDTGGPILLSPIVANGIVYVLQDRGTLLAIQ